MNKCLTGGKETAAHDDDGHDEKSYAKVKAAAEEDGGEDRAGGDDDTLEPVGPKSGGVAFSIWLGILIDGVPESMLIGFMQSEGLDVYVKP